MCFKDVLPGQSLKSTGVAGLSLLVGLAQPETLNPKTLNNPKPEKQNPNPKPETL